MRHFGLLAFFVFCLAVVGHAQDSKKFSAGFGAGLDFGGLGTRVAYLPIEHIGLFGGLGYNLDLIGYNVGAQVRLPAKQITGYFTAMYGYNAVLIVSDFKSKTTYYGPTVGAGLEIKPGKTMNSFFSVELLLPFRPKAYHNAVDALRVIGYEVRALPIGISIGYHFKF